MGFNGRNNQWLFVAFVAMFWEIIEAKSESFDLKEARIAIVRLT